MAESISDARANEAGEPKAYWVSFAVAALVGAVVVWATLFAVDPFTNIWVTAVLGCLMIALIHGQALTLVLGWLDHVTNDDRPTRLSERRRTAPFRHKTRSLVLGVALGVLAGFLDWIFLFRLHVSSAVYVAAIAGGFALALALVYIHSSPRQGRKWRQGEFGAADGLGSSVLVLVVGIAVLSWVRQGPFIQNNTDPTPRFTVAGTYVALGDSYAAGEGLKPYQDGTAETACDRSKRYAYSVLLSAALASTTTTYRACSGGLVPHIYAMRDKTVPAQVSAGVFPGVGLVTIMAGGNDVNFANVVAFCLEHSDCTTKTYRTKDKLNPTDRLDRWAVHAIDVLTQSESEMYGRLRSSYPNARILVIGYPYLVPYGGPGYVPDDCAGVLRLFSEHERSWVRNRMDDLNNMLYAEAIKAGIEFVSPTDAWRGHEACGTKGQFTNSVKPILRPSNFVDNGSFHPNRNGQHELAEIIAGYLVRNVKPPNPFVGSGSARTLAIGEDYCPSHLGLVQPPGELVEHCPGKGF